MHTVAPIWRVAALLIPLASLVGCDWLPVRRRIDPAMYPVPARPDPGLIRGDRKPSPVGSGAIPHPTALAGLAEKTAHQPVLPLPELVPVSPDELFGPPAPTPMLDAALVRAQAIETAVFEDEANTSNELDQEPQEQRESVGEDPFLESIATDPSRHDDPADLPGNATLESIEVPPIPDPGPEAVEQVGTIGQDVKPDASIRSEMGEPIQTATPPVTAPEGQDAASLKRLLEEQDAQDEERGEAIVSREHLLKQMAEARAEGHIDDPSLWQTVMFLLSESEPEPGTGAMSGGPVEEHRSSFRVARIAFCREVLGFDQIKPFDAEALESGQKVLIYAEVEGVHYLPEANGHVSQLSTTLEILAEGDTRPLWSDVLPVEDRCSRPRHDYFVGYRVTLPESLKPGRYRLRVAQHDLLSGQGDTAETPFVILAVGD